MFAGNEVPVINGCLYRVQDRHRTRTNLWM